MSLVERYRHFRLFSLSSAPDAFASTYEQEVEYPTSIWVQRLRNQDAVQYVATRFSSTKTDISTLKQAEWVGMVVLVRKQENTSKTEYDLSSKISPENDSSRSRPAGNDDPDTLEGSFYINGLFTDPSARSKGLGGQLLKKCFDVIEAEVQVQVCRQAKVATLLDSWNSKAKKLYEANGFQVTGTSEYMVGDSKREALSIERWVP